MAKAKNDHVWDYLTYYLGLPHPPNFAVLLSGPWGVGKTFLLKRFLAKHFEGQKDQYVYVSLYGLSDLEEIDDALLQAIFPTATGKVATVAQRVAKSALKYFNVDASGFNLKDFLNKLDAKVYVFDDLERFEGTINKVLGYINQFVEHGGSKVILIANEREISVDNDYSRRREKLIGKTLHVQSSFDEAFAHFISEIDDSESRNFVKGCAADIATIYDQSELNNLRILQQTIWDFERFHKSISAEHRQNNDAMATVMRLLFVLSFELKAGRVGEEDLLKGRGINAAVVALMRDKKEQGPKPPIRVAKARYPVVDIDDTVFSNELLVDFLIRGIVDTDAINKQLRASRFFVTVADEPAWRTVWHYFERTDEEFDNALSKMEVQYAAREFTIDGEILHVLGLRLLLADRGAISKSRREVLEDGKKYIDELYQTKTLHIDPPGTFSETRFDGYGGLGIHESKTAEYKELFTYLKATRQKAFEDTYAAKAIDILDELKRDVQQFYRRLCYSGHGNGEYASIPVLAKIDPDAFLDTLLSLRPSDQHVAMMALKARFEHGRLDRELPDERPWLEKVRDDLLARARSMKPMSRHRVESHVTWYIKPVLQDEDLEDTADRKEVDDDG
jgi:hypothetical protein